MKTNSGELGIALSPDTGVRECLIKLVELIEPELVNYFEVCLRETTGLGDKNIPIDDPNNESELAIESESEFETDQLPDSKIDSGFHIPTDPDFSGDEVSHCLLELVRVLRPDLADQLEQINFFNQEMISSSNLKEPTLHLTKNPSKPFESSEFPLIQKLSVKQPQIPKPSVQSRRSHLKPCLLKLIRYFDPELAECLRECS
ncbi:unnamed protein product [Hymenolepis diminuta]|uniref:Rho-GAP domain-containing protein n=1 Tax=Hymenolepis diminuta TaxID=6216 RepID=A0A0R3SXU6_HYMDI|nr:unnamed protein product [Hymenolepis diminuta]VUZ40957.1 unnamed protein product [Hymenolepis diminuta]